MLRPFRFLRRIWVRPEVIARFEENVRANPHGVRLAILFGASLGLTWALLGRLWMRLISDDPVFSVGGTIFIFVVVSGFGAAAGYAFSQRGKPAAGRFRGWFKRGLAFVPFLGMGPGLIFYGGRFPLALVSAKRGWRRLYRVPLLLAGGLFTTLIAVVMLSDGLLTAVLFVVLGYILFFSLRLALEAPTPRDEVGDGAAQILTA